MTTPVTAPETALIRELRGLIPELQALYNEDFISLNVYGPAVDLERPPRDGEVQVLVVLRDTSLWVLARVQELMADWWKSHRVAPLYIGQHEFYRSLDVFPLEFLQMKRRYICLYGEDVLARMAIETADLRLELEGHLKTKAFWLRQFFVRDGRQEEALRTLVMQSFQGVMEFAHGLLALKSLPVPAAPAAVMEAVAAAYGLDAAPVQTLLAMAAGRKKLRHDATIRLAFDYDRILNTLSEAVDAMEVP